MAFFQSTIGDVVSEDEIFQCGREVSLLEAVEGLKKRNCGAIVVVDDEQSPIGILSERDLLYRTLADPHWGDAKIGSILPEQMTSVSKLLKITNAIRLVRAKSLHYLVVVDDSDSLYSIVSVKDIVSHISDWLSSPK